MMWLEENLERVELEGVMKSAPTQVGQVLAPVLGWRSSLLGPASGTSVCAGRERSPPLNSARIALCLSIEQAFWGLEGG